MSALGQWVVRHPVLVLVLHGLVTVALGFYAAQIRIESSLASLLPEGDPEIAYYMSIRDTFGSDEVAVIGVRADDLFSVRTLEKIARVTDRVEKLEGVERVLSLTNAVDPGEDVFDPPLLLPNIPPGPGEIDAVKKRLNETPLFRRNLVADDLKGAAINVFLKGMSDVRYRELRIDDEIEAILARESGPERFFYTGAAHLKQEAVELMRRDLFRFTPIAVALLLLTLWLSFRTVLGLLLPLITVSIALIWTLGVMHLAGKSITLGTFVLPPLLLVIGTSYAIHVVSRYYLAARPDLSRRELLERVIRQVSIPVLISALTTMIGFGSLMVNRITAIWDFGLFSVVGIVFLTICTLGFLPSALQVLSPRTTTKRPEEMSSRFARRLGVLGQQAFVYRKAVLGVALAAGILSIFGGELIQVDSNFLTYFDPDEKARRDHDAVNEQIVGSSPFFLVVEAADPGMLEKWEVLKQIRDLQHFVEMQPGVTTSISLVNYLELLERGLNKGGTGDIVLDEHGKIVEQAPVKFWDDPKALEPVIELIRKSPSTFSSVVTPDFRQANILVRTRLSGSREIEDMLGRVRAYIAQNFSAQLRVRPTGDLVLLTGTTSDIVTGQVKSLLSALIIIFIIMSLMFLSARVGMLAILPNILPIALFFGVMGFCGIQLNMGTSLIASIALGIAVDSTIHYMSRLNLELKGQTDQTAAVMRTMEGVGVPILYANVALFFGFVTFAFSGFVPIQNFGILSGVTMITAVASNLVLLPALLSTTKIITLWDLVGVSLGQDPARTIPLFAGLRPAQARIVVLMGQLKRFAPGEAIVKRGEMGSEMYVIIQGKTQVWAGAGEERRRVIDFQRGDVFGEMALVRHNERSADVIASEPVEALAIDERFLDRIQRRYPRIASKVFLNLTRILSDRLERTTEKFVASH